MSTSDSTIKGKYDELAGKVKQGAGEAFNDQELANKGSAQQVKGHAEQAWGSVKEGVQDLRDNSRPAADQKAHDARESMTSTAQNMKESIKSGVEKLTGHDKNAA